MEQQIGDKPPTPLSVQFLARPSASAHALLHGLGQAGLTIDLQLLSKMQLPTLTGRHHDIVVIDADQQSPSNDITQSFLDAAKYCVVIAVIDHDTAENRMLALSYGAELLYSASKDITEMQLMLNNMLSRQQRMATETLANSSNTTRLMHSYHGGKDWLYHGRWNVISHCDQQREVSLTKQEGKVLQALISHHGDYVDRDQLFRSLGNRQWSYDDRTVDVLISRLRKKISQVSVQKDALQTGYGAGYRLKPL